MRELGSSSTRINRWLSLARWAPSGGNYQPWQATGQETESEVCILLKVHTDYLQTAVSLDQHHWLGVFSLGSITYNLKLCAEADGFSTPEIELKTDADPAHPFCLWKKFAGRISASTLKLSMRSPSRAKRIAASLLQRSKPTLAS